MALTSELDQSRSASVLRLGTRGSLLARTQSQLVADELMRLHPGLSIELIVLKTSGDQIADRPLHEVGGKGLFTKELEQALLNREVDFAVHSFKDMPTTMPLVEQSNLIVAAVPPREDVRDLLISAKAQSIEGLSAGAKVGTGSLRRRCQLLRHREDLKIEPIRGNIDTRLGKLREGHFDAIVLAAAGIARTGLFDQTLMTPLDTDDLVPAPGQGALALQCREDDASTRAILESINDVESFDCVSAERELVRLLRGDCLSPIAALATLEGDEFTLKAAVGAREGNPPVLRVRVRSHDPLAAAHEAFHILAQQHVEALLHGMS